MCESSKSSGHFPPVFEDSFSYMSYNEQSQKSLTDNNLHVFQSILSKNILSLVESKTVWKTSDLEEDCEEITDKFAHQSH